MEPSRGLDGESASPAERLRADHHAGFNDANSHADPTGKPLLLGDRRLRSNTAWDLTDTGLYVSADGGRTWSAVALPTGLTAPLLSATSTGTVVSAIANRAVWLATREADGYRIYTRLGSASDWTSMLLIPTWPAQSVSGPPESIIVTPGAGGLLTVAEYSGTGMSVP